MHISRYKTQRTKPHFTVEVPADYAQYAQHTMGMLFTKKTFMLQQLRSWCFDRKEYAHLNDDTVYGYVLEALKPYLPEGVRPIRREQAYLAICKFGVEQHLSNGLTDAQKAKAREIAASLDFHIQRLEEAARSKSI